MDDKDFQSLLQGVNEMSAHMRGETVPGIKTHEISEPDVQAIRQHPTHVSMKAARAHDDAVVELLREDPTFTDEYLAAALGQAEEPGGVPALLRVLHQIAQSEK